MDDYSVELWIEKTEIEKLSRAFKGKAIMSVIINAEEFFPKLLLLHKGNKLIKTYTKKK